MLIAEELMLMATLPTRGRPPLNSSQFVEPAVTGVLVAELAILGRVDVDGGRLVVCDPTATGDDLLDDALGQLANGRPSTARNLKQQLKKLDAGLGRLNDRVTGRLVSAGILGEQRRRRGVVNVTRHPVVDQARHLEVIETVRAAVRSQGQGVDPRTNSLIALLGAAKLLGCVVENRAESKRARAVARVALESCAVGKAVAAIVAEIEATAAATAVLAVTAGG